MEDIIGIIMLVFSSAIVGAVIGICIYSDNIMIPMDVYQGKTTLEYKVIDGVKVDSTVVWKEK